MTSREIKAKVNNSSLGTKSARAARKSVSDETARRIVARSQGQWAAKNAGGKKPGG